MSHLQTSTSMTWRLWPARLITVCLVLALSACGGGGGDAPPPTPEVPATPLPATLSIAPEAPASDLASTLQFKPSNDTSLTGLSYAWSFGDGGTSTLPQPSYKYAKAGDYVVELKLSNGAGQSRSASYSVSLDNKAHLAGLSCDEPNQSGWCKVYPKEDVYTIEHVQFVSSKIGWAVSHKSTAWVQDAIPDRVSKIIKTTDGGQTWVPSGSFAPLWLDKIWALDESNAWALHSQTLYVTKDGGNSWQLATDELPYATAREIIARSSRDLILCDSYPVKGFPQRPVSISRDGGVTWTPVDAKTQWVQVDGTLWRSEEGRVSRSLDLGATFQPTGLEVDAASTLQLVSNKSGQLTFLEQPLYGYGKNVFWRSLDGGQTWRATTTSTSGQIDGLYQTSPGAYLMRQQEQLWHSADGGISFRLLPPELSKTAEVRVLSGGAVMALNGWGERISVDGGASWQAITPPRDGSINYRSPGFVQLDGNTLITWRWSAEPTAAYLSKDLGKTWQLWLGKPREEAAVFAAVYPINSQLLLALDTTYALLQSKDAGRAWQTKRVGVRNLVQSEDRSTVWAREVGPDGNRSTWLRSRDGGDSWQPVVGMSGSFLNVGAMGCDYGECLGFLNGTFGWASSETVTSITRDGGDSWTEVCRSDACPLSLALAFRDELNGFAITWGKSALGAYVGDYRGRKTTDGGKTWTDTELPSQYSTSRWANGLMYQIEFAGPSQIWTSLRACTGPLGFVQNCNLSLLSSADSGSSWMKPDISLDTANFNRFGFFDADHGWVHVPVRREINFTRDGGKTWSRRTAPFDSKAMGMIGGEVYYTYPKFIDMRTGWIVDRDGALFATGTGGGTLPPAASAKKQ